MREKKHIHKPITKQDGINFDAKLRNLIAKMDVGIDEVYFEVFLFSSDK